MRHNRNVNQTRGTDRISSGASNLTYNFSSNSSVHQEKSTDSSALSSSAAASNRNKMVRTTQPRRCGKFGYGIYFNLQDLSRSKSPVFNRRRASSITLARTIPNFGAQSQAPAISTSPAHNPNDLYRYIKSDEQQRQNPQQWNEQSHGIR